MIPALVRRLRALLTARRFEREMAGEMRMHLEQATALMLARGMSPADAALAARREFGNVGVLQEEGRDARGIRFVGDLISDIRYGLRQITRAPVFAAVVVLVLAIGIGVNSAAFTIFRGLFDRPLPGIHHPDGLVRLSIVEGTSSDQGVSYLDFLDYRMLTNVFSDVAVWTVKGPIPMDGGAHPGNVVATFVSDRYFTILGTRMALGKGFPPVDDRQPQPQPLAIAGYRFWKEQLGGARSAIGRRITLNRIPVTVIGVSPEDFNGIGPQAARGQPDLWLPVSMYATVVPRGGALTARDSLVLHAIARLRSGVGRPIATAAAAAVARRMAAEYPPTDSEARIHAFISMKRATTVRLDPPSVLPIGGTGSVELEFGVLFGTIGTMILLIACANASNLLLARAVGRRREIAVRLSLGASRIRIVRQLLTESFMLALAAGAVGLLLQVWTVHAAPGLNVFGTGISFGLGWDTLLFATMIAMTATLVFGLAPALHASRGGLSEALKDGASGPDQQQTRQQAQSVILQVALSLVFVCCSGPFIGFAYTVGHGLGFDSSDHVLVAKLDLRAARYSAEGATALLDAVKARLEALPGVSEVSSTNTVPFALDGNLSRAWRDDGSPILDADDLNAYRAAIDSDYFATMGIPIVRGRGVGGRDRPGDTAAAVIDARTAQVLWPGRNPIGRTVRVMRTPEVLTVVGVAGAMRVDLDLGNQPAFVYVSRRHFPDSNRTAILLKAPGDAASLASAVRQVVGDIDPHILISEMETLGALHDRAAGRITALTELVSALGAVAFLLAAIGLYAVVAFGVSQRSREIGIRMALGARHQDVAHFFFRQGGRVMLIGFAVGLPLAFAALTVITHSMFPEARGMLVYSPFVDLRVTGGAAGLMAVGAALAIWIPARRAATVDPVIALRSE